MIFDVLLTPNLSAQGLLEMEFALSTDSTEPSGLSLLRRLWVVRFDVEEEGRTLAEKYVLWGSFLWGHVKIRLGLSQTDLTFIFPQPCCKWCGELIVWFAFPHQPLGLSGSGVGSWALLPSDRWHHSPWGSCPICCGRSSIKRRVPVQRPVCHSVGPAHWAVPSETLCETPHHSQSQYYSYSDGHWLVEFELSSQKIMYISPF